MRWLFEVFYMMLLDQILVEEEVGLVKKELVWVWFLFHKNYKVYIWGQDW